MRRTPIAKTVAVLGFAFALNGCAGQETPAPSTMSAESASWKAGLDDEVVAALSKLPEEDRTAALAQKVCPVSGEPLGSMGTPPKVAVEGQVVFICCDSCEGRLKDDPSKYLAKLKEDK